MLGKGATRGRRRSWGRRNFRRGAVGGWGSLGGAMLKEPHRSSAWQRRGGVQVHSTAQFQPQDPARHGPARPLTRPGSAATAQLPVQPLNPEPAEHRSPRPWLRPRPRGRDPNGSAPAAGGGVPRPGPASSLQTPSPPPPLPGLEGAKPSCSFWLCSLNNFGVSLKVLAAVGVERELI